MDAWSAWLGPIGSFIDYALYWVRNGHLPG